MNDMISLVARVLLAAIFILAGINKITGYADTAGYMTAFGVPGMLLPAVIAVEIVGGLAILAGFMTRWAALALAAFSLLAAVIFHLNFGDQMQSILFMKNLAIAGGLLLLYVHGGGSYAMQRD